MSEVIPKIIPIILLISLGKFIRYKDVFKQKSIDEIKKFLVDFVLPAVLFLAFFNMEIKKEYYLVAIVIYLLLCVLFAAGLFINRSKRISHPILPFAVSICSIAFLGLSIFPSVFGEENLTKIAIIAMGHELFVWTVSYPYLGIRLNNKKITKSDFLGILKAPIMIGILIGIILNTIGLNEFIHSSQILKGLYNTAEYLSKVSTPLILIIIGYGLKINKKYLKQSSVIIAIKVTITLILGSIFKYFIINNILEPNKMFDYAYFTFLILPPPLTLPLMVGLSSTVENEELANSVVVLNTLLSITVYLVFVMLI